MTPSPRLSGPVLRSFIEENAGNGTTMGIERKYQIAWGVVKKREEYPNAPY
jgi:hypothetical protein